MMNKMTFKIGFISILIFIVIATIAWYKYFNENEGERLSENIAIEFLNNGGTNYLDATTYDLDENIPIYYFRVKNNWNEKFDYEVHFKQVKPSEASDGCTEETTFALEDLMYELSLDNRVIKTGLLSEIDGNILDTRTINEGMIYDYTFRVWLKDDLEDYNTKHFHYIIELKEKENNDR